MTMIKEIRKMLGMSQSELAIEVELTQGAISHYETGLRSIDKEFADKLILLGQKRKVQIDYNLIYGKPETLKTA